MPEYIEFVLKHAGKITSSRYVKKYLEIQRKACKRVPGYADAYNMALDELVRSQINEDEEVYDFLLRVFKYGDIHVAKREACMIESRTGWT